MSQKDFAPLIGASLRHLIRLENGQHLPSGDLRDRIVTVTGTEEQIEASDDKEEDLCRVLQELAKRKRRLIRVTGDPFVHAALR